jgi:hypothetical protein
MADDKNTAPDGENITNNAIDTQKEKGTDPKKTDAPESKPANSLDLTDEQFEKVFEDERLFKHSRFKSLRDKAKRASELETEAKKAEEKQLADQKKWQELAEKRGKELEETKGKYTQATINNAIQVEAQKQGLVDVDATTKLIDRANISIDDNGNPVGVAEAVTSLVEAKPYLKTGTAPKTVGAGTNPSDDNNTRRRFKHSEIKDPAFFAKHEKEIDYAMANGLIEDDLA